MSVSIQPLYEPIKRNLLGIIYPTEGIKSLVKNEFESDEDIKFKKQYILSWAGLITAIIIGFSGILYSIYSTKKSDSNAVEQSLILQERIKNEKEMTERVIKQLENLNGNFEEYVEKDTLIKNLIKTNNTQNAQIIKRLKNIETKNN